MVHSALWVVGADTGIAIVAGFVIFPALFAMGVDPAAGPGLVFIVFPSILGQMPGGYFFGIAFFALLTLAALTSSISLMEVVVAYIVEEWGWTRKKAVGAVLVVCGLLAIPSALAFGASGFLSALPGVGMDFLSLMDIVFGNFALAVGALLIAVFTGYVWGVKPAAAELTHGNPGFRGRNPWTAMILVGAPVAIAVILVNLIRSTFF